MLPAPQLQPRIEASCQGLPEVPVEVCWNILGHTRAAWTVDAEALSWDRFGFSVREGVRVVMDAFQAGETKIATVEYRRCLHRGPHAVVQLEFDLGSDDRRLHEVCTTRAVRHWVRKWSRAVRRRCAARVTCKTPSAD